jgi:hypothetical protein
MGKKSVAPKPGDPNIVYSKAAHKYVVGSVAFSSSFCENGVFVALSTDGKVWTQPVVPDLGGPFGTVTYWDKLNDCSILLDKDGSAFVADFGLARWQNDGDHLTATGAFLGTPAYVAPEQVSRAPDFGPVTPRTDLYSLGVVIYQMLTGRLPFAAADGLQSLYQIVHETPPPPSESPLGFIAVARAARSARIARSSK